MDGLVDRPETKPAVRREFAKPRVMMGQRASSVANIFDEGLALFRDDADAGPGYVTGEVVSADHRPHDDLFRRIHCWSRYQRNITMTVHRGRHAVGHPRR